MPYSYIVKANSRAKPSAVYAALIHAGTWPLWSPIDSAEIEGGGDPDQEQEVGETRVFRTGRAVEVYRSYKGGITLAEVDSHESYRQPHPLVRASLWEISSPGGTGFVAAGRVRVSRHSLEGVELELLFFAL
ncbi:SRPBCC family protein [Amycolatopsis rhizosphaerae]|uniref:SRPBCC family protein n=1 Tax=Amycolatopsis rhizosphaerae TaxID=2053003 RepID=UPI001643B75B|nr:SRPBCC family protein [Amycolatopsis rhizosphaerae]